VIDLNPNILIVYYNISAILIAKGKFKEASLYYSIIAQKLKASNQQNKALTYFRFAYI
jgi:hypothetical protein